MNIISEEKLKSFKSSDTIVVYGSSWSINDLSDEEKEKLSLFDSIGFNYFCKSKIPTTFYILREQSVRDSGYADERKRDFVHDLNKYYGKSILLFIDMLNSGAKWKGKRGWINNVDVFKNDGIVLKEFFFEDDYFKKFSKTGLKDYEIRLKPHQFIDYCDNIYRRNIFLDGIYYFYCTLSLILHFATFLGYKKVLFVGVDLYDHRYFWLPYGKLREQTRRKKRGLTDKHKTCDATLGIVEFLNKRDVDLYTYTKESLLSKHIKVWEW
jgi:hypothetical protein